jgi:hypothetical protein
MEHKEDAIPNTAPGERKLAIIVRDDLASWQKLNVASFLAGAVAIQFPDTHGGPLVTASGTAYLPLFNQPVLVYRADDREQIKRALTRAKERELHIGIYSYPLFATMTEEDNLRAIADKSDADQDLVGIVVFGEYKKVNKALDGLKLHP